MARTSCGIDDLSGIVPPKFSSSKGLLKLRFRKWTVSIWLRVGDMARKRRYGKPISPWLSANEDCCEKRFVMLGHSLLMSPIFQGLSGGTKHLYLCMALECGGRWQFTFPLSAAKKYGISSSSFRRSINELLKSGLIARQSMANLRQPNEYKFEVGWKMSANSKSAHDV